MPTLVPVFQTIRAYIAANSIGLTRDEAILEELTKILHAKIHDEYQAKAHEPLSFYALATESAQQVANRLRHLYLKTRGGQANGDEVGLLLDDDSCAFAVRELQGWRITGSSRDIVGEAYETLVFPALRGGQGQFFTPKNAANLMVRLLSLAAGEDVIDPACGTGTFLTEVATTLESLSIPHTGRLVGIDKDHLLARLAQDHLELRAISGTVACANSLAPVEAQQESVQRLLAPESYDAVITNPPFGAKIPVAGDMLSTYELAYVWRYSKAAGQWERTERLRPSAPPQILFLELCWRLLKEGGRCAIVLPEGVLGNQSLEYLRQWLLERADVLAVIDSPLETFMPSTSTKTTMLVFQRRRVPKRPPVFMAVAERCGHDRRGKPLLRENGDPDDDFPKIAREFESQVARMS